jgi:hypothetical protein
MIKLIAKTQLAVMNFTYALADALFGLSNEEKTCWHEETDRLENIVKGK